VIFLESFARPLMVCHAITAAVLVGATTHHLLWCRHYLAGSYSRVKAERRFATICAIAFISTFAAGNLLERNRRALMRVADPRVRRQKAYALLARNGFSPDVCRDASRGLEDGVPDST